MMERKTVLAAVVLLGLLCAAVAQGAGFDVTTAFGSGADGYIQNDSSKGPTVTTEFGGGADTYITNNIAGKQTSTENWGTEGRMRIRTAANSRFMASFLRFDINEVSDPFAANTRLQLSATFLKGAAKTLNIFGLADSDIDDNWIESGTGGITYATAPGFLTPAIGDNGATVAGNNLGNYAFDSRLTLLGTITFPGVGTVTLPKNIWSNMSGTDSRLADFLNADGNGLVTLVLIAQTGSEDEAGTKENTAAGVYAPALVPEPATMLILGLGSLMVVRRKK
jgi:hypothetical protein